MSNPPYSPLGDAKRAQVRNHKLQLKSSSKEGSAATNVSATAHIRSRLSIDVLLTPKEAAHYLRVSLSWLAKARRRGDGPPFISIGRSIRYAEATLIQWMKGRQRLSTSERV
jgi:predicted DNA-binding transcriptional regulator AlpA